jgi:hypothetical protein
MKKSQWEQAEQIASETKIKVFWDDHWYITYQGTIGLKENAISGPFDSTEAAFKSLLPNEETEFLTALRQPGANKPLQTAAKGHCTIETARRNVAKAIPRITSQYRALIKTVKSKGNH